MRQDLSPICIICAFTAVISWKFFDTFSITAESKIDNSEGVIDSASSVSVYTNTILRCKMLVGCSPNPLFCIVLMQASRFCKTLFQHSAGVRSHHGPWCSQGLGLYPNKQNTHGKFSMPCVFWPLCAQRHCLRDWMKKLKENIILFLNSKFWWWH